MNYQPVDSSNIEAVGYDPDSKTLGVRFKDGGIYHYEGVSPEKHQALLESKSAGSHFHQHIKPHHKHTKQDTPKK